MENDSTQTTSSWRQRTLVAVLLVLLLGTFGTRPAHAGTEGEEGRFYTLINGARAAAGLGGLQYDPFASSIARSWSATMAASGTLYHNPNLVGQINGSVTTAWTGIAENVGVGYGVDSLHNAFMASSGHRANVVGNYNRVGIGVVYSGDGRMWVTEVFINGPSLPYYAPPSSPPPPPAYANWHLRNSNTGGPPDMAFAYGLASDQVLSCDWNGDGIDSPGIYRNGWWDLRNSNSGGSPDMTINYGVAGYAAVCGDWNGDGVDTIGTYINGYWYLRNSNSGGPPDIVVHYGAPGYTPVVGDWNGDGVDTIGTYVVGFWDMRNSNSGGAPNISVWYGAPGYAPIVGDWNGDGVDTIGTFIIGNWFLRNSNNGGLPNISAYYGVAGYRPVPGDWNGDKVETIGVVPG